VGEVVKWLLIGLLALNVLLVVGHVGKPRGPITRSTAVAAVVMNALVIVAILAYWGGGRG
jgi:hypothetical protein